MQKIIDPAVIQHNWFSRDKEVSEVALSKSDQDSAYVNVGGQKVVLSSIPKTDREQIIAARQKAGLPVTEKSIAEMYVRKNNMKKSQ